MLLQLVLLVVGLALVIGGGEALIRGASGLARTLGVSPLVVGLTVVAFGTSAPELTVNVSAAVQGNSDISFGNIIGSNIANIGLIIGISALVRPLVIQGVIIVREIPMMLLASAAALIAGMDQFLRGTAPVFDRAEGLLFLLLFCVFLFYTIGDVIRSRRSDPLLQQIEVREGGGSMRNTLLCIGAMIFGLLLLVSGGDVAVDAAVALAEMLDLPGVIIGFSMVAIGTSLPELVTSLLATLRGQTDIAIGNVVGSNIFNLLLVNGLCATIRPIEIPASGGSADLLMMGLLSLLILPMGVSNRYQIVRWEGGVLLFLYLAYMGWRVFSL